MRDKTASAALSSAAQAEWKPSAKAAPLAAPHPGRLNRLLGNHAIGRFIQTKLQISQQGDAYEEEANRIAEQVMRMPDPAPPAAVQTSPLPQISRLQHKCASCEEEEVQRQPMAAEGEKEEEETIQAKEAPGQTPEIAPGVQAQINGLQGRGQPLPGAVRAFFEPRFGYDFSQVRLHTDVQAAESARAVNALAYTVGRDVVFGAGQFAPGTEEGKRLLAHELTHTAQQREGSSLALQRQPAPPPPGSVLEQVLQALATVNPVAGVGEFPTAFRLLDGLPVEELLAALTDLEGRFQLDLLIANSGTAAPFNQARLVTAMQIVRQSHGAGTDLRAAHATVAAARLPAYERLALTNYLLALRPAVPSASGADQRAAIALGGAAALPDADLARELGYELDPSSRPAPVPPVPAGPLGAPPPPPPPPPARIPWDGRTSAPGAVAARAAMQSELFTAYDAYLTHFGPTTVAALAQPRVAFTAPAAAPGSGAPAPTGVVDIANQARAVLEARYATSMDAAATTPVQLSDRSLRQASGPGQNLFDASSEADRSTLTGSPDLAPGVAWWLFENDTPGAAGAAGARRFATEILAAHHYSTQDPGAEQFRWDVANAYAAASTLAPTNQRQLIDYRMTGWSERGTRGITLQSSFAPGSDRDRAELAQRWVIFQTATHENLHLRTHPAFAAAEQGRGAMKEGFTEMFTIATLNTDVLPRVRAGSAEPLRRTVEGSLSTPTPDAALIINRATPTQYAAHRAQAERIRDGGTPVGGAAHVGVGEAAVRAAYFQGHVEYLGLAPAGSQLAGLPAAGVTPLTRIPGGLTGLDDLARRSGVTRATIEQDNPGITDALPAAAVLSGCREHWVVGGETRANIAAQHGVSEADLVRANPDLPLDVATSAWPALTAGQKILIPVH